MPNSPEKKNTAGVVVDADGTMGFVAQTSGFTVGNQFGVVVIVVIPGGGAIVVLFSSTTAPHGFAIVVVVVAILATCGCPVGAGVTVGVWLVGKVEL